MPYFIASYYGLFAIMGESTRALGIEASIMLGFIVLSIVGFRSSLWLVAAALVGHGFLVAAILPRLRRHCGGVPRLAVAPFPTSRPALPPGGRCRSLSPGQAHAYSQ